MTSLTEDAIAAIEHAIQNRMKALRVKYHVGKVRKIQTVTGKIWHRSAARKVGETYLELQKLILKRVRSVHLTVGLHGTLTATASQVNAKVARLRKITKLYKAEGVADFVADLQVIAMESHHIVPQSALGRLRNTIGRIFQMDPNAMPAVMLTRLEHSAGIIHLQRLAPDGGELGMLIEGSTGSITGPLNNLLDEIAVKQAAGVAEKRIAKEYVDGIEAIYNSMTPRMMEPTGPGTVKWWLDDVRTKIQALP